MATQINRPIPGVMYGVTHTTDGELMIREPKILKVGIGLAKGPALDVWIAPDGKWKVRKGYGTTAQTATFQTRAMAEAKYNEVLPTAPACPHPRKIGYFTFTKPVVNAAGQEQMVADFDAIEAHGPTPTEIDIVLLDDQPFNGAYQMWSSSELLCRGDGINAMRLIKLAATAEEKDWAATYAEAGEKTFPIGGCWTAGCPYSKETVKNGKPQPSACKPGADLKFQLAGNIRVGGTAYFHTTSFRSIGGIFSSLHRISTLTSGRLSGLPVKMCLRPFRSNHNGQAATHYAVSLEFRAPDAVTLRQKLLENVFEFRVAAGVDRALAAPVKLIDAPDSSADEADDDDPPISAASMAAEFYPEATEEDGSAEDAAPETTVASPSAAPAAEATQQKTSAMAEKLRRQREKGTAAAPATAVAPPPAPPSAEAVGTAAPTAPVNEIPAGGTPREDLF